MREGLSETERLVERLGERLGERTGGRLGERLGEWKYASIMHQESTNGFGFILIISALPF